MNLPDDYNKVLPQLLSRAHQKGEWRALDRVLNLINTYDKNLVNKKDLYSDVLDMRPKGPKKKET